MRIAILADIHGNLPALEAVMEDLEVQSPDVVLHAGDLINRCPWNNEVLDIVRSHGWLGVEGNHERVVGRLDMDDVRPGFKHGDRFADLWWSRQTLDRAHLEYIRGLPAELRLDLGRGGPLRILHGVRGDPFAGILPDSSAQDVEQALLGIEEPVVICAHTHRPMTRSEGGRRIFNGGSVGMPYNGDPRAQYVVLSDDSAEWAADFRQVDYDRQAVVAHFEQSGFAEAIGPLASVFVRTILTGDPWASDFGHWMKSQPESIRQNLQGAIDLYMSRHGPGNWSFLQARKNGAAQ